MQTPTSPYYTLNGHLVTVASDIEPFTSVRHVPHPDAGTSLHSPFGIVDVPYDATKPQTFVRVRVLFYKDGTPGNAARTYMVDASKLRHWYDPNPAPPDWGTVSFDFIDFESDPPDEDDI
jgi:hypothetical protein